MNKKASTLLWRSILVVLISIIIPPVVDSIVNSFQLFLVKIIISAAVYAAPNLVFIWILYVTSITKKPLLNNWVTILECAGFYLILFFTRNFIGFLTQGDSGMYPNYWYTSEAALLVYSFALYFLIILVMKGLYLQFIGPSI